MANKKSKTETTNKAPTPKAFAKTVAQIIAIHAGDPEASHGRLDDACDQLLIDLGYGRAVELIKKSTRWCG